MGFQEVPDDAVKHFLLPVRERHVKQSQFKWFMLYKADEMAGFSCPELALFIKLFNQESHRGTMSKISAVLFLIWWWFPCSCWR